jgi:hypothetical protein
MAPTLAVGLATHLAWEMIPTASAPEEPRFYSADATDPLGRQGGSGDPRGPTEVST